MELTDKERIYLIRKLKRENIKLNLATKVLFGKETIDEIVLDKNRKLIKINLKIIEKLDK